MKYESVAQALEQLQKLSKTYMAYTHAMGVMELDAATAAPSGSWEGRGVTSGILSEVMYNLTLNRISKMAVCHSAATSRVVCVAL
jgi:Zn-dependent M32 family carboxypeptidase